MFVFHIVYMQKSIHNIFIYVLFIFIVSLSPCKTGSGKRHSATQKIQRKAVISVILCLCFFNICMQIIYMLLDAVAFAWTSFFKVENQAKIIMTS